jgi:tetratricopeptide (TPR) repeat protein
MPVGSEKSRKGETLAATKGDHQTESRRKIGPQKGNRPSGEPWRHAMIMTSATKEKKQFVFSPPQFQLEPPGENPFEAMPTTSVINRKGSFDLEWVVNPVEQKGLKVEEIFEDMLMRSLRDVGRFPSSAQAHANYGLALMNRGRLEEAADEFIAALKISPHHFMSCANLARIYTAQGRFTEAERLYESLSTAYPKELSPLVNLSYIFLRTGRRVEASEILRKAIEIDADAAYPRYLMAISLLTLGKPKEAISNLRIAARSDVRSPAIYQALGVAYLMGGDAKGAERSFKTALALAPEMREAVLALANVLLQHGRTKDLIALLLGYLGRRPNDITARGILSEGYSRQEQYGEARQQLMTALRYVLGDSANDKKLRAQLFNNIGSCFDRQGDIQWAMHWTQRSIDVDPQFNAIPYHNLASQYARKNQFEQALRILENCKTIFPQDRETVPRIASVLVELKRIHEAIELLREEINTGNAAASTYGNLGSYFTELRHDFETALHVLSDGLMRYPRSPKIVNNLAYTLLMAGRHVEARELLTSAGIDAKTLKLDDRVALTATWGLLYLWEGDISTGRLHYEEAAEIAVKSFNRNLRPAVQQKMHLELGKTYARQNNIIQAKSEIVKGLLITNGQQIYERDLLELSEQLEGHLGSGQS